MARPRGVKETKPRNTVAKKVAALAVARGISPLQLMLTAMRDDWKAAQAMLRDNAPEDAAEAEKWSSRIASLRAAAISTADKAAPYVHARLQSIDSTNKNETTVRVIDDMRPPLAALARESLADEPETTRH